jgi:XTP/dITP diphosphohydrolase
MKREKYIEIAIASRNKGKIKEIKSILSCKNIKWLTYLDFKNWPEVEESANSYEENALKKAKVIANFTKKPTLAEDSGLEIDYLKGEPGVGSARYAGENSSDLENFKKVLNLMKNCPFKRRTARFRCVAVLYLIDGKFFMSQGKCEGKIGYSPHGKSGFGYDPIFVPEGHSYTMAQIGIGKKNKISHRAKALKKLFGIVNIDMF